MMEISENTETKYYSEESSEFEKIVKLIQSNKNDAAELIFEELKKSIIKRKGKWMYDDRIWPHQNGKTEKNEKSKRKLKIVDNQELYTRFVPVSNQSDENKPPVKEPKKEEPNDIPDTKSSVSEDKEKSDNKRLTISNRNDTKKDEQSSKKLKTDTTMKSKEESTSKVEKTKLNEDINGKGEKYVTGTVIDDDVELLLSLSNGDQEGLEPKILRKRKDREVKKENPALHKINNGGIQKRRSLPPTAPINLSTKSSKGNEPLFNLKENMKNHESDALDAAKIRQKMFYGSAQVTRRDKPRREGTLADDSKKRLEAKLKKVKAKLKKSA